MAKQKQTTDAEGDVPEISVEEYMLGRSRAIWAYDDTGHSLNIEEQLFVRSYILDRNGVAAMRRLGYTNDAASLKRTSDRYLNNPEVQGAIEKLAKDMMDRLQIDADTVNAKIAAIAYTNVTDVMHYDGMNLTALPTHLWPEHAKVALASIKKGQYGVEFKFHDKHRGLEFLGKQLGLGGDEADQARAMAEAGAMSAITKIMDVVQKKQAALPAPVSSEIADVA